MWSSGSWDSLTVGFTAQPQGLLAAAAAGIQHPEMQLHGNISFPGAVMSFRNMNGLSAGTEIKELWNAICLLVLGVLKQQRAWVCSGLFPCLGFFFFSKQVFYPHFPALLLVVPKGKHWKFMDKTQPSAHPVFFRVHSLRLALNTKCNKGFAVKRDQKFVTFVQKLLLSGTKASQLCCTASAHMFW